jgi:hypothetical protein
MLIYGDDRKSRRSRPGEAVASDINRVGMLMSMNTALVRSSTIRRGLALVILLPAFRDVRDYESCISQLRQQMGLALKDCKSHVVLNFYKTMDDRVPFPA